MTVAERRGDAAIEGPVDLPKRAWRAAFRRTVRTLLDDELFDWAAALTYYSVLSIFPAIVVLVAAVGLVGQSATQPLIENAQQLPSGQARDVMINILRQLEDAGSVAGPLAIVGLLGALWAASAYIGGFIRAANAIYEMAEGRPVWKTLPLRVALTLVTVTLLSVCAFGVIVTGAIAERLGRLLGLASTGVLVWDIAKWPVLASLISLVIAMLYWAAPNVRQPGFRWLTPGSVLAVLLWVLASAGFAFYVGNFGNYDNIYGSLAGVVVFLVWLWISNLAVLLGAKFDAELARGREIARGHPKTKGPFLAPRDTRAMD
jgi:membrane protein